MEQEQETKKCRTYLESGQENERHHVARAVDVTAVYQSMLRWKDPEFYISSGCVKGRMDSAHSTIRLEWHYGC